ncbi:PucR family transcriptional regulator [Alkaliphilus peptidifermentans]|uniref:PucR C-terminal helix-turn-helix domain-containing protein n=1 Tax=Alkaliphilus peptidifermentans DSM 18978 TaxID=1120976 RepID=A0A1G5L225_9FIRM|nr:helix-turn-helix domain-containing protein [Alkaliphilus peptidifermentans]SCZ06239.1 PucR C-terminal helix-turn-helix domain-containing protein [Alkaliphilus peptidifermentans DSM 18978]
MAILFQEVFKCFSLYNPKSILVTNEEIVLSDTKLITKDQLSFHENVLYVGKTSLLTRSTISNHPINLLLINDIDISLTDFCGVDGNIIELSSDVDLFTVFNEAKDLFIRDLQFANNSAALLDSLIQGKGLNYITELGSSIINNPIILIDFSYKVLSHAKYEAIIEPFWIKNIDRGYCSYEFISEVKKIESFKNAPRTTEPFYVTCYASDIKKIVSNVMIDNKIVGYLIALECSQNFNDKTQELLRLLSNVISQELRKNKGFKNTKGLMYENLLLDLLDEKINKEEILLERIKSSGYQFSNNLYVLSIDLSRYASSHTHANFLRDSLESIFSNFKSVFYQDTIVILLDIKDKDEYDEAFLSKLKDFLRKHHLLAGLSSKFSKLLSLNKYYDEAIRALQFGIKLHQDDCFFSYEVFKFYHLLSSTTVETDLIQFCHPAVIKLKNYDKKNNTAYYETLSSYLYNNQNMQNTAKYLFIHRNTLNYRMRKIKELVNFDLSDSEVIFQIHLSYKIMDYLKYFNTSQPV